MKCCYCNKSIKGSTDQLMSVRIKNIRNHEKNCNMNPENIKVKIGDNE